MLMIISIHPIHCLPCCHPSLPNQWHTVLFVIGGQSIPACKSWAWRSRLETTPTTSAAVRNPCFAFSSRPYLIHWDIFSSFSTDIHIQPCWWLGSSQPQMNLISHCWIDCACVVSCHSTLAATFEASLQVSPKASSRNKFNSQIIASTWPRKTVSRPSGLTLSASSSCIPCSLTWSQRRSTALCIGCWVAASSGVFPLCRPSSFLVLVLWRSLGSLWMVLPVCDKSSLLLRILWEGPQCPWNESTLSGSLWGNLAINIVSSSVLHVSKSPARVLWVSVISPLTLSSHSYSLLEASWTWLSCWPALMAFHFVCVHIFSAL